MAHLLSRGLERFLSTRRALRLAALAAIGAVGALGQAPFGLWPLTVLSLALLLAVLQQAQSWRQAGVWAWAAGTGYFMLALFWIVEPFFVDAARHGWMAPFALFFLSLGMGLFWAGVGAVTQVLRGRAMAFVALFVLVEALRTYALTGFPWAQLGHVLIDTPLRLSASIGGSLGLTFLVLLAAVALRYALSGGRLKPFAVLVGLAVLYGYNSVSLMTHEPRYAPEPPIVRLIQPNAPQHEKWDPEKAPIFFRRQLTFSVAPPDGRMPDLVVWPETSVPILLRGPDQDLSVLTQNIPDRQIVVGMQRAEDGGYFNSLLHLDDTGAVSAIYDKHHLVPFGEYMPFQGAMARLGISGLADQLGGGYSAGPGPRVLDFGALGTALPLICYEGVFPHNVNGYVTRPDFLLLITNDAWFGDLLGPYQHLEQARLRSTEQGLPMVRVANTGVSAMIDAKGRITHQLPLGQSGWMDAPLPLPETKTIYAGTGDLPFVLACLALLGWCALRHGRTGPTVND